MDGSKRNVLGDLSALQRHLDDERKRLQLFVIKAKQDHENATLGNLDIGGAPEDAKFYFANEGERCGPEGRFRLGEKIGKGIFSTVYKCTDTVFPNGEYAIKFTRASEMFRRASENEVKLMERVGNEASVNDLEGLQRLLPLAFPHTFLHKGHLAMLSELMKCDLRYGLERYGQGRGLPLLPTVRNFGRDLLLGLRALHASGVVHCDVKPENLLLSFDRLSVKLADFGSAMPVEMADFLRTDEIQPRHYRSPEVMLGHTYGTQIDVWSAGVTVCELATSRAIFKGKTNNKMLHEILKVSGAFPARLVAHGLHTSRHFTDRGAFIATGDDDLGGSAILEMLKFPRTAQPFLPLLQKELRHPRGVDAGRFRGLVRHFADLVLHCLAPDALDRATPALALSHRFFEKGA